MQAQAGQDLRTIVARKEVERCAGESLFLWGIGNAPARQIGYFSRLAMHVDVVFSVMKTKPKLVDRYPRELWVWRGYMDRFGNTQPLPNHVLVMSGNRGQVSPHRVHYALVCKSDCPLMLKCIRPFDSTAYRNVGGTGAPVAASQVTALLRRVAGEKLEGSYSIDMRAGLTGDYWVKLTDPRRLDDRQQQLADRWMGMIATFSVNAWTDLTARLREGPSVDDHFNQPRLFSDVVGS